MPLSGKRSGAVAIALLLAPQSASRRRYGRLPEVVVSLWNASIVVLIVLDRRVSWTMAQGKGKRAHPLMSSRDRLRESAKALFADHGFEDTTTAAICRLAGTSQSQLIKHFTDKKGVLEAIFEHAWGQINPAVRLATESIGSPRERLKILIDMVLGFLEKDHALRTLFLLEGRRLRGDGHMVVLVPGFLEFVRMAMESSENWPRKASWHPTFIRRLFAPP